MARLEGHVRCLGERGGLASVAAQLTGAFAAPDAEADRLADLVACAARRGSWSASVRAAMAIGPASAVKNAEELYEAGLPRKLRGGLAEVAISDRAELIATSRKVHELKAKTAEARTARRLHPETATQGKSRRRGRYDRAPPGGWSSEAGGLRGESSAAAAAG